MGRNSTRNIARGTLAATLAAVASLLAAASAPADDWFPHPAGAQWQYLWSDSTYDRGGTIENVTVQNPGGAQGCGWQLAWTATPADPSVQADPVSSSDQGTMCFQDQNYGLQNTDWSSAPPPTSEPILCPWQTDPNTGFACANTLLGSLFNVIWGSRAPVISEPLLQGTNWTGVGGAYRDVTSSNQYVGMQTVKVPAFPQGVLAAVVRSQISQAGALGDPYGSGIRTIWWVRGVGPVRVVFAHDGGSTAPETDVSLVSTSLTRQPNVPDQDYFPLRQGLQGTYSWTNARHLQVPEVEKVTVAQVANRSARVVAQSVSGPIKTVGQYGFSVRLDGVTNTYGQTSAASVAKLPPLGNGRHFFTPVDLMVYGFNPLLPAYPQPGNAWRSGNGRDFQVYGVRGTTEIIGYRTIHVPAGTFRTLVVQSTLAQAGGHRFGSGVRTCWFAAGRGLVKLVFRHRDGSVSVVSLVK